MAWKWASYGVLCAIALASASLASAAPRIKLGGKLVTRLQALRKGPIDIDRVQTQLRLSGALQLNDQLSAKVRLTGGPNRAPNLSLNETRDFFHRLPLYADRYFLEWKKGPVELRAGRVPPLGRRSELIYDGDINVDGLTAAWRRGPWTISMGLTALHEVSSNDNWAGAPSFLVERKFGESSFTLGYHRLGSEDQLARGQVDGRLQGFDTNRRRMLGDLDGDGIPEVESVSRYRLVQFSGEVPVPAFGRGGALVFDFVKNQGASDRNRAGWIEMRSKSLLPGVTTSLAFFRIGQDAVVSGYHGEILQGTNLEGLRLLLVRPLGKTMDLRGWYATTRGLEPDATGSPPPDVDEVRLDLVWKF